jgi:DNA-binding ferritin-like protein (Dps family)
MKNIFFLFIISFVFLAQRIEAQKLIFHKTIDSVEVKAFKDRIGKGGHVYILSVSAKGKIDTLWDNHRQTYVYRIVDIKLYKNKFAMIYYGSVNVVYVVGVLENGSCTQKRMSKLLGMDYENFACTAEILNFDKVRVQQKGVTQVIKYDTEKGIELSRTVEKQ